MMSSEGRVVSGDRIITILLVFSALGPIAGAVLFALALTTAILRPLRDGNDDAVDSVASTAQRLPIAATRIRARTKRNRSLRYRVP